jgi:GAF domain-containing protein
MSTDHDLRTVAMHSVAAIERTDKNSFYRELAGQLAAVLEGERDPIANAANLSALVFELVPDLNWAGFYFLKSPQELVLGPFQGKVACVRIAVGKGVCGTAVAEKRTMLVQDVHAFPGHIACDANSRSELVVPLTANGHVIGVLDLDSPLPGRFDADDQAGFERLAGIYIASSDL